MTDALWWTAEDAHDRTRDPSWPEALLDVPALLLDLRDGDVGAPPPLRRASCPVIAVLPAGAETTWPVDLALAADSPDVDLLGPGVDAAVTVLTDRAAANPTAAATLARVLRVTSDLDVDAALEVESLAYSMLLAGGEFRRWLEKRPAPRAHEGDADVVRTERSGGMLQVTLNRPHVHNAFNAAMRDALLETFDVALADWSVGTVALRGEGATFCSGGDLSEFGTAADPALAHVVRTGRSVGAAMHRMRDRLTVHVHGSCLGAGVELPAFARRVVAAPGTTFRLPEVGMGLIPGAGGTVSLPRRIGPGRTLLHALSGVSLGADDARRWGLVDEVA